jgi:RES domain-containing protein
MPGRISKDMSRNRTLRDDRLIDALDALPRSRFNGTVWRVVREGRDPTQCSASGGRWDDGTFDVLYTSRERDGALAEMYFHLLRGQPVFPSRIRHTLHELRVSLKEAISFPTLADLQAIGMDTSAYGQLLYAERQQEYPGTQEIAEVAHFLGCDGVVVPSARMACANVVLFCDLLEPDAVEVVADHGPIDWTAWARDRKV